MNLFRSLKHRNFRLFFFGQALSLFGVWMQGTAVSWLTWRLTLSPKWLGAVGFATQIPILVIGLFAGVVADRMARHKLVMIVQITAMIQASILAALTITGYINAPLIFILSLSLGFVFAFDYPSRQSFLTDMVGRDDIGNAVALNSSIVHGSRVLGPVAAGFVVARFGEGACFSVNAASYLFVLAALLLMNKSELYRQEVDDDHHSVKEAIIDGLRTVKNMAEIRRPLILMCVLSLAAMPYVFFLPQIIGERFGGTARELGVAMGASGLGALAGAVCLAVRRGIKGLYGIIKYSLFVSGIGFTAIGLAPAYWLVLPALALVGVTSYFVVAGTNIIMQTLVPPRFRGRVMSIFTVAFFGFVPVGSIAYGWIASSIGVGNTIAGGGVVCILAASLFIFKRNPWKSHCEPPSGGAAIY